MSRTSACSLGAEHVPSKKRSPRLTAQEDKEGCGEIITLKEPWVLQMSAISSKNSHRLNRFNVGIDKRRPHISAMVSGASWIPYELVIAGQEALELSLLEKQLVWIVIWQLECHNVNGQWKERKHGSWTGQMGGQESFVWICLYTESPCVLSIWCCLG